MFGINPWVILAVVLAFMSSNAASYLRGHSNGVDKADFAWTKKLETQKDEANKILIASKDAARDTEREWQDKFNKLEADYVAQGKKLDGTRIANGRLVAAAGGLFDNNGRARSRPSGGDGVPGDTASAGGAVAAATGCQLSDQVTQDLLDFARDADEAATLAQLGHGLAVALPARAVPQPTH